MVHCAIIRPGSTLKFQFAFGFNECLWAIFSLLSFKNFWINIWVLFDDFCFYDADDFTLSHLLPEPPMSMNKKLECNGHKIYFKMLRKICKKEV